MFAGKGKCRVDDSDDIYLGSPLLSITTSFPFTNFIFVDKDEDNIRTLKERCSASLCFSNMEFVLGDSNLLVSEIIANILEIDDEYIPGAWSSLNLAFLDPDGLALDWNTVVTLAQPYSMDLIIHYPQGGLNRSMAKLFDTDEPNQVDAFFGGIAWREIYIKWGTKTGLHRQLMDYYKGKLRELGYKEVLRDDETGDEPLMRNARRNAPLYRLLFASKHELGHDFWGKVTRRDVHGQSRLPNF